MTMFNTELIVMQFETEETVSFFICCQEYWIDEEGER